MIDITAAIRISFLSTFFFLMAAELHRFLRYTDGKDMENLNSVRWCLDFRSPALSHFQMKYELRFAKMEKDSLSL